VRTLSPRERVLLVVGAIAAVGFVCIFGLILPMRDSAGKLAQTAASLRAKVKEANRMYSEVPKVVEEIATLRADTLGLMFDAADARVGVMREIDRLAAELDLTVASLRPGEAEAVAGCVKYPTTFVVESDFSRLVRLLYELEQPDHRLWVEGVEITASRTGGGRLRATLHVAAYVAAPRSEEEHAEA
jgi:hypothetical protein